MKDQFSKEGQLFACQDAERENRVHGSGCFGDGEGLSLMITLQNTLWRVHTHTWWQGYCLPPTLSPPIYWIHINAARRGVCVCVIIIASDFFFFQRMQNNGRGGALMWEDDPGDGSDVLSVEWTLWLTSWPREHTHYECTGLRQRSSTLQLPRISILHSFIHSNTNKSEYLRADTKVTQLDLSSGVHQHIGRLDICGDKLLDKNCDISTLPLVFINSALFFLSLSF